MYVQCTYIPVPEKRWPLTKSFSQTHSQLHNALYSVHCTKLSYSLLWVEPGPKLRAIPATAPPKKLKKVIKYLEKIPGTLTWQTTKKNFGPGPNPSEEWSEAGARARSQPNTDRIRNTVPLLRYSTTWKLGAGLVDKLCPQWQVLGDTLQVMKDAHPRPRYQVWVGWK